MSMSIKETEEILINARKYIGKTYNDIDCSHFVWQAYKDSGKEYPYRPTATFDELSRLGYFDKLDKAAAPIDGDLLLFSGHIGIWDSKGCTVLVTNAECKRLKNDAPFLSSRSGDNRGPDYGRQSWWGNIKAIYRWKAQVSVVAPAKKDDSWLDAILNSSLYSAFKKFQSVRFNNKF